MLYFKKKTQGFTLIEALIALTVTSLGALALASFQTDLTKTGGLNKTRSEALVLAEAKLAAFKNITDKTDYDDLENGLDTVNGTNASFTRQWTLTDKTNPERKQVEVTVEWGTLPTDKVTLMTELTWTNPGNSNLNASAGANQATPLQSPSPNNNSSTLDSDSEISDDPKVVIPGHSDLFKAKDIDGNTILTERIDANYNILLTCFGNTLLEIKGTVYTATENKLDDIGVAVSQYGYCAFNPVIGEDGEDSAPYSCFVCGNDNIGNPDNPVGPGGWRGKVGLTGLVDSGGGREKVCQSEHINDTDSEPSTAREYTTLRNNNGTITSEGINTPYVCQHFLIVNQNGSQSNCATAYATIQALDANFIIANKKITRTLTGTEDNTVLATNTDACSSAQYNYTVSGTISGSHTNKVELAFNRNGQFEAPSDPSHDYQFNVTSNEPNVTLTATISHPGTQISATVDSCTTLPTITGNNTTEVEVTLSDTTDSSCINFTSQ